MAKHRCLCKSRPWCRSPPKAELRPLPAEGGAAAIDVFVNLCVCVSVSVSVFEGLFATFVLRVLCGDGHCMCAHGGPSDVSCSWLLPREGSAQGAPQMCRALLPREGNEGGN
jgi:hypothetical protein